MIEIAANSATHYRVRVVITPNEWAGMHELRLFRVDATTHEHTLIPGWEAPFTPGVETLYRWDGEAPLGRALYWALYYSSDGLTPDWRFPIAKTDPLTLTAPTPVLSDPYRKLAAAIHIVGEGEDRSRSSRTTAVEIEGRSDRVVVWDVEGAPSWSPVWITPTLDDREALDELLEPGGPVLLRAPCPNIRTGWLISLGSRKESPIVRNRDDPARRHTLDRVEFTVSPTPDIAIAGDTLTMLSEATGTMANLFPDEWLADPASVANTGGWTHRQWATFPNMPGDGSDIWFYDQTVADPAAADPTDPTFDFSFATKTIGAASARPLLVALWHGRSSWGDHPLPIASCSFRLTGTYIDGSPIDVTLATTSVAYDGYNARVWSMWTPPKPVATLGVEFIIDAFDATAGANTKPKVSGLVLADALASGRLATIAYRWATLGDVAAADLWGTA